MSQPGPVPFIPAAPRRAGAVALTAFFVLAALVPGAHAQDKPAAGASSDGGAAAVVNGRPIPAERVAAFVRAMVAQGREDNAALREAVREELIARELFVQEAEKRSLDADADVAAQLARARQDILIGALIRDQLRSKPVTDDEIRAAYERFTSQSQGAKEYRARHILVETEAQARDLIRRLGAGEDFVELAKQSQDPGSAGNGGDLDWSTPDTFVREFSEAMVGLDKGQVTSEPVKTQFGYHVIRLDDVREALPPSIDSLRPQIKQQLERDRVVELQGTLREQAEIK